MAGPISRYHRQYNVPQKQPTQIPRERFPPGKQLARALLYLCRDVSRVIPGCGSVVVIHEKRPSGLGVDFDLPAEGQGVAVVVSHGRRGGACLHGAHAARAPVLRHFIRAAGALKTPWSDVGKWAGSFWK